MDCAQVLQLGREALARTTVITDVNFRPGNPEGMNDFMALVIALTRLDGAIRDLKAEVMERAGKLSAAELIAARELVLLEEAEANASVQLMIEYESTAVTTLVQTSYALNRFRCQLDILELTAATLSA